MKLPRENAYICPKGHITMTVDVDEGVTPMFIGCKRIGCRETASSTFYPKMPRPAHLPAPQWEWYLPTEKQAKKKESSYPGTIDHVRKGGLLLRERTNKEPIYHEESNNMSNMATIEIVPGNKAPKYTEGSEIELEKVVITEKGTESGLPIVDFVMKDSKGNKFVLVLTGRILNSISSAVKGVNARNHGIEEP